MKMTGMYYGMCGTSLSDFASFINNFSIIFVTPYVVLCCINVTACHKDCLINGVVLRGDFIERIS